MNFHILRFNFFSILAKSFKKIVNTILTTHGARGLAADMNDVEANSRQNSTISHFSRNILIDERPTFLTVSRENSNDFRRRKLEL